jgi:hypothetical protein
VRGMLSLYEELETLSCALGAAGIEFALCGGLALAVHGHPRATRDIDLLLQREQLELATKVAHACGFTLGSLPMRFAGSGIEMQRVSKVVGADVLMLDFLLVDESLRAVWENREQVPWRKGSLPVVSREGLVSMKLASGRPQDLADLALLQESE